ncbi:MAG: penicillin acylase family protein, partial [Proteobacteria bacterium]|nr:penicillin acylase family protein [Pseudomonadota bacterium]
MTRALPMLALLLTWAAGPLAIAPARALDASLPRDSYALEGLSAPGEILIDQWGVPHIYAQTHYDAFFLQGFNAARDRLWQIDLWRRRGLGQLAEVFGPEFVEQDAAARQFLYRGSLFREWLAYGSDAEAIAEAFVAGVNAYIGLTEQGAVALPPEFSALGYRPARWTAADVVRIRSHGLWRNVLSEVARARSACVGALDADGLRSPLEPAHRPILPEGLDPCSVPEGVLDRYLLATSAVKFKRQGDRLALQHIPVGERMRDLQSAGSNNWVVGPARTDTGRPILADDPHRSHALPSLRYIAHLNAPELNVIGAGEPALPGISIGHNERIAFGLTIFAMDQEDLLFYDRDGDRYRYQGRWEPLERIETTIEVRDQAPVTVSLAFTRHGPVVFEEANRLWVVRAAWLEPGMAPYFGSVEYMRAKNWRGFVAALNRWGAPSENQVYADRDGNIGYKPAGLLPRRRNYDGLLPVPGDGRYEWDDFHSMSDLPEILNPEKGWYATANNL